MTATERGAASWCWCDHHTRFELFTRPPGEPVRMAAVFALTDADVPAGVEVWPLPPDVQPALDLARAGERSLRLVLDAGVDALNAVMAAVGYTVPPLPEALRAVPTGV